MLVPLTQSHTSHKENLEQLIQTDSCILKFVFMGIMINELYIIYSNKKKRVKLPNDFKVEKSLQFSVIIGL